MASDTELQVGNLVRSRGIPGMVGILYELDAEESRARIFWAGREDPDLEWSALDDLQKIVPSFLWDRLRKWRKFEKERRETLRRSREKALKEWNKDSKKTSETRVLQARITSLAMEIQFAEQVIERIDQILKEYGDAEL